MTEKMNFRKGWTEVNGAEPFEHQLNVYWFHNRPFSSMVHFQDRPLSKRIHVKSFDRPY